VITTPWHDAMALALRWPHATHEMTTYFSPTNETRSGFPWDAMHDCPDGSLRDDTPRGWRAPPFNWLTREFGRGGPDFETKFQANSRVAKRQQVSFDYFKLDRSAATRSPGDADLLPRRDVSCPADSAAEN